MNTCSQVSNLSALYLWGMLVMSFITPIMSIVSQLVAIYLINRYQKWRKSKSIKKDANPISTTDSKPQ